MLGIVGLLLLIIFRVHFQWLEKDFLGFLRDWEEECLQTNGLTMGEKRRMCLSRETLEGLRITGINCFKPI